MLRAYRNGMAKQKFLIYSEFGEILDLAIHLQYKEKHEVLLHIPDKQWKRIGDGIIQKTEEWYRYIGEGYTWIFDSTVFGDLQDWLREKGEAVFGGSAKADEMENDRQKNQEWFREAGFKQPFSQNFTSIEEALQFVMRRRKQRWILKQNGSAPKTLNHLGKFGESEDLIFHLQELKRKWNEFQYGKFDVDLMEVVEGLEVAASAFFNGREFVKNGEGKVVGFLNFEEKKEADGNTGETTGEMGTTFIGVSEDNLMFNELLLRPKIIEGLREMGFRGVFDINAIRTQDGFVALEPTLRFGVPSTSYELIEGMHSSVGTLLSSIARGEEEPVEIHQGIGMVMVVVAKPFPLTSVEAGETSVGERLWIMQNGALAEDFSSEQLSHIHLYNFEKEQDEAGEIAYKVPTKDGYLLTVTARGEKIATVRSNLIKYIQENIYLYGMKYRTDIGERVEKQISLYQ
jgi:phosphoribosylamine-glycine ligase